MRCVDVRQGCKGRSKIVPELHQDHIRARFCRTVLTQVKALVRCNRKIN
jgi:hypothetical protein